MVQRVMRRLRLENKNIENAKKTPLKSVDVLNREDFTFSSLTTKESEGDSGNLLLAKNKINKKEKYLIKHAYCDCAANEFIYTKLAQAMNVKMPDAKLFQISTNEKRNYFKTEYILGCSYLDLENSRPTYDIIRNYAINWEDFFRFRAMEWMFLESDGIEIVLAKDDYIYRVDTTASFTLSEMMFAQAGINEMIGNYIPKDHIREQILSIPFDKCWNNIDFELYLTQDVNKYGNECEKYYLEPFFRVQEISDEYIDDIINTLCYFYPDFIGDYYKLFIHALQKEALKYLHSRI